MEVSFPSLFLMSIPDWHSNVYPDIENIIDTIHRNENDLKYLLEYMELRQYKIEKFPEHLRILIYHLVTATFQKVASATFHISSSIQLHRDLYTSKLTANELYVFDHGEWIRMTDFLRLFDVLRNL